MAAYAQGYFPMAEPGSGEIVWLQPLKRAVFLPGDAHCSHTVRRLLRGNHFQVVFDRDFASVIRACAGREETWISEEIIETYTSLHELRIAHSVEAYRDGRLAGGLYGLAIGGAFFGESMFWRETDASKVAFAALCDHLDERGYQLHDAQFMTPHLARLGARELTQKQYLRQLEVALHLSRRFV